MNWYKAFKEDAEAAEILYERGECRAAQKSNEQGDSILQYKKRDG